MIAALKSGAVKTPFIRPAPVVVADFSQSVLKCQPAVSLPPDCSSPFTVRVPIPGFAITTQWVLKLTVDVMPANVTMQQFGPLLAIDQLDLLSADGRSVYQSRPSYDCLVWIKNCMDRENRRTAQALNNCFAADCTAGRTFQQSFYIPLPEFFMNDVKASSSAYDLRTLAPQLNWQVKFRTSDNWCFASGTGGAPGTGVKVIGVEFQAQMYDMGPAALGYMTSTYVPRSLLTRSHEIQIFPVPASPAGTTAQQTFTFNLTALSAPCVNLFGFFVADAPGTDGSQTSFLPWDTYSLSCSGQLIFDSVTLLENSLTMTRLFGVSPFSGDTSDADGNTICISFAAVGLALDKNSAAGAMSFRSVTNPQLIVKSSDNQTIARNFVVVSSCHNLINVTGPVGSQRLSQSADAY